MASRHHGGVGDVWLGAVLTAALFEVGKFLIGLYIGKQGLESTYGAAAWANAASARKVLSLLENRRFAAEHKPQNPAPRHGRGVSGTLTMPGRALTRRASGKPGLASGLPLGREFRIAYLALSHEKSPTRLRADRLGQADSPIQDSQPLAPIFA
jgi:hypothetical protein